MRHLDTVKTKSIRKPFVTPERLTERPLSGDARLVELRNKLERDRRTVTKARTKSKKENNR